MTITLLKPKPIAALPRPTVPPPAPRKMPRSVRYALWIVAGLLAAALVAATVLSVLWAMAALKMTIIAS